MARPERLLDDPSVVGIDPAALDALYARAEKDVGRSEGLLSRPASRICYIS